MRINKAYLAPVLVILILFWIICLHQLTSKPGMNFRRFMTNQTMSGYLSETFSGMKFDNLLGDQTLPDSSPDASPSGYSGVAALIRPEKAPADTTPSEKAPTNTTLTKTGPPVITSKLSPDFQLVKDLTATLFVYSAIWQGDRVRIISIKRRGAAVQSLHCALWNSNFEASKVLFVRASVDEIPEHHSAAYTGTSITCFVDAAHRQGADAPAFVALVPAPNTNMSARPGVTLPIKGLDLGVGGAGAGGGGEASPGAASARETEVNFTVCTPPMFGKFGNAARLVEKIEMSRLLGAGRVVLYNNSVASNVDAVLRMYAREWAEGREKLEVKVFPWQLPVVVENGVEKTIEEEKDIHYFGQMAAVDHCLYRYRHLSRYTDFSDLDEFVVPVRHDNWMQLITERQAGTNRFSSFMFRSTVFNQNRPSPAEGFESNVEEFGSSVLGLTSRDRYFFPSAIRSKLIVDPKQVSVMGIHFVWKGSGITDKVPVTDGFLAHYRMPLFDCKPQEIDKKVSDKFGKKLLARLQEVWSRLRGVSLGWAPVKSIPTKVC